MVTAVDRKMSLVKSENKIGSDHETIDQEIGFLASRTSSHQRQRTNISDHWIETAAGPKQGFLPPVKAYPRIRNLLHHRPGT